MQIELSKEQLQYLKSLDSKKKKRKFLLDCFIENIEYDSEQWFRDLVDSGKVKIMPETFTKAMDEFMSGKNILKMNGFGHFDPKGDMSINLNAFPVSEKLWKETIEKSKSFINVNSCEKTSGLPKQTPILTGNPITDSINIGISAIGNIKQAYKSMDERKEIIAKSNEVAKLPADFCVQITDENKRVLEKVWREFHKKPNSRLLGRYFHSNSLHTSCSCSDFSHSYPIVTTNEFLKHIGREDLIERKESVEIKVKYTDEANRKSNYSQDEIDLVAHNIEQRKLSEKEVSIKWDMNKLKQSQEFLKFDILTRQHKLPFLTEFQKEGIVKWMNDWEQLKDTAIPIRFSEDCKNTIDRTDLMIEENNFLSWFFNRLVLLGENPHFDYMIKLHKMILKSNENAK